MKIEYSSGDFVLDANALAERFGLSAEAMRSLMRRQLMRGTVEKGEGVDARTWRLTMRYGIRVWRAVVMEDGELREEAIGVTSVRPGAESRRDVER